MSLYYQARFVLDTELAQLNSPPGHPSQQMGFMYGASQGKIGQHDDRVCLEVRAEFFSRHMESECHLLKTGISSFYLIYRFAYEEH